MKPARALGLVLAFSFAVNTAIAQTVSIPAQPEQSEPTSQPETLVQWFACTLGGKPCGGMEATTRIADGKRTMTTTLRLLLRRDASEVESGIESILVEALDGTPLEMGVVQDLGGSRIERRWLILPNRIRELSVQGRRKSTRLLPLPSGTWYSTAQAQRLASEAVDASPDSTSPSTEPVFSCRVLDPSLGANPVSTRYWFVGRETTETPDGPVECTRWRIERDDSPSTEEWLDSELQLVRARTALGGGMGEIEMRRARRHG
ncbi:MAG: hypothetical protein MK085_12905 [Phycisphaerales bacterium]|nr:hypothetical protein [Phycisphaerales bacterium]